MGGVVAIFNRQGKLVDKSLLIAMAERSAYRGPDGLNYWSSDCVGIAHLALNTTPESHHECQPLVCETGNLVLATDARIDNRSELLRILHDYFPRKDKITDADIILAAYRKWGINCPAFLIGDFTFVLWDGANRRLIAARDALGVRPLHYALIGNDLCLATEAQQILAHPQAKARVNELALVMWLIDRFDDNLSMFQDIARLPAAHVLVCTPSSLEVRRYWDIDSENRIYYRKLGEYAEHLRELLNRCVADRLRTDRAVIGSQMSGGMDSTSVTACAYRRLQNSDRRLIVFSWQFATLKSCDEMDYIRSIIDFLGLSVKFIDAERFWILDDIEKYAPPLEFPGGPGFDSLYHAMLGELARFGGNVMLTGHGGDNMTWGTPRAHFKRFWHGNLKVAWEIARLDRNLGYPVLRDLYSTLLVPFASLLPASIKQLLLGLTH